MGVLFSGDTILEYYLWGCYFQGILFWSTTFGGAIFMGYYLGVLLLGVLFSGDTILEYYLWGCYFHGVLFGGTTFGGAIFRGYYFGVVLC